MPLFETKERTRTSPKRQGERNYDFYDTSGRNPFVIYRETVEGWLAEFPAYASEEGRLAEKRGELDDLSIWTSI